MIGNQLSHMIGFNYIRQLNEIECSKNCEFYFIWFPNLIKCLIAFDFQKKQTKDLLLIYLQLNVIEFSIVFNLLQWILNYDQI